MVTYGASCFAHKYTFMYKYSNVKYTNRESNTNIQRGANGDVWSILLCTQEGEDLPLSQQIRPLVHWSEIFLICL